MIDAINFMRALFDHMTPGVIEVRMIEDRKGGRMVHRDWFDTAGALVDALPRLSTLAREKQAGIFFGVLPRCARGKGKAEDIVPGMAAWADLDFKDFEGGEKACRKTLADFPLRPSIVVHSGHGLHGYWLLREQTDPSILVDLAARLAATLGGDNVADAPRLLRLPGTVNRKNSNEPVPVEIESLTPNLCYNEVDFDEVLPQLDRPNTLSKDGTQDRESAGIVFESKISQNVQVLLDSNRRLSNLFNGEGKPECDEGGRRLDRSSSGYDYSFTYTLAMSGVSDESELATALWHRPDNSARLKGEAYVIRTVLKVLNRIAIVDSLRAEATSESDETSEVRINFTVDRVRTFNSVPRLFELTIQGQTLTLNTTQLLSTTAFRKHFVDVLNWVPRLPIKPAEWSRVVNRWLAEAEVVNQPPEASADIQLREEIELVIKGLAIGESIDDLDQGKALEVKGKTVFKVRTIEMMLKETYGEVKRADLCLRLHTMGYESNSERFVDGSARVWKKVGEDESPSRQGVEA